MGKSSVCFGPHAAALAAAIRADLLAAAGVSDKAQSHLPQKDQADIIDAMITAIVAAGSQDWREEILYRFLLTRGDSLGGSMRNYTGAQAAAQLAKAVRTSLQSKGIVPTIAVSKTNPDKTQAITWPNRALLIDRKFKRNNVDAILLDTTGLKKKKIKVEADRCLALGELKGGIDPAGADEHWKTASAALERLRTMCGAKCPTLFFVGAAIETAMANEIFTQLTNGSLTRAANLTVPQQLADLADWLCGL